MKRPSQKGGRDGVRHQDREDQRDRLREGMEDEITGKLANKAFVVVPRPHHNVMG